MRPKNQRSPCAPNRGAKDDLGPNPVAHNRAKAAADEYFLQPVSRSPYRNRTTDRHFAEIVKCDAVPDQLCFKPAAEAESELWGHVRAQVAISRQREQKRFHPAVQIAGRYAIRASNYLSINMGQVGTPARPDAKARQCRRRSAGSIWRHP